MASDLSKHFWPVYRCFAEEKQHLSIARRNYTVYGVKVTGDLSSKKGSI